MNPNSRQYQDQCDRIDYHDAKKEDESVLRESMDAIKQKEQQERRILRQMQWRMQR